MNCKHSRLLVFGLGTSVYGLEKQTINTLKHMNFVDPYFLVSENEDGSVSRLLTKNNFRYEHVPSGYIGRFNLFWTLETLLKMPILMFKVYKYYVKYECNQILILNLHPILNASISIFLLKYLKKAPIIFYFLNIPEYSFIDKHLYKMVNLLSNKVIALSDFVRIKLMKKGIDQNKIEVVYGGVNINKFYPKKDIGVFKRLNLNNNTKYIGFAGQFMYNKGIFVFVDSAELVIKEKTMCKFLMIGKFDKKDILTKSLIEYINQKGLNEYIIFTDWVDDIENIYPILEALVVPSIHEEPFGLVNIEAMSCSIPVISSNVGGIKEIVVNNETGFLVEPNNPGEIADKIIDLVSNSDRYLAMKKLCRNRVKELFDLEVNSRKLETILLGYIN